VAAEEEKALPQVEHLFLGAMVVLVQVTEELLGLVLCRVEAVAALILEQQVQAARAKSPSQ
jgi:hypothetical protein